MKEAVIIGSGQTGRGLIAPILQNANYHITFLDKDREIIYKLNQEGKYQIEYFDICQKVIIQNFNAIYIHDEEAILAIASADIIFTSVFVNNIQDLIPLFEKAQRIKNGKLTIICCENGINVKKDLVNANLDAIISEGVIFCTTIKKDNSLDLMSENNRILPIDGSVKGLNLDVSEMPYEYNFKNLIERKIYTYNFMSAVIAYLGYYKGYEIYSDAANDIFISKVINNLKDDISRLIADKYNILYTEQLEFTKKAIAKFKNPNIVDFISRNAYQAKRKLGLSERILFPLQLAVNSGINVSLFLLVLVAAIHYAKKVENENMEYIYFDIYKILDNDKYVQKFKNIELAFENEMSLNDILLI